ncbi:hypothetical protein WA171_000180 [Blastocystis sp. BT1]
MVKAGGFRTTPSHGDNFSLIEHWYQHATPEITIMGCLCFPELKGINLTKPISIPPPPLMLSEYELLNLISEKRYTRISGETVVAVANPQAQKGLPCPIHIVDEEEMMEHNYFRPSAIRNVFDLFLDNFQSKENMKCVKNVTDTQCTPMWQSYIEVLEDILTLATRITTLRLYSASPDCCRIDNSPVVLIHSPDFQQLYLAVLLPPSSLSLISHFAMWSIGGTILSLSPLLSPSQIKTQIEKYGVTTIVTTSEFAEVLLSLIRDDPTVMTSLTTIILNDPWISESSQKVAELFSITLYQSTDLLNPTITITRQERTRVVEAPPQTEDRRLQPPPLNSPQVTSRRRRLRLVRKQMKKERAFHIASVDDYDDNDSEEPVETLVFPFLAYDPGLLDTAVILISTSRTQSIHTTTRTHLQLLSQCDLWKQRILPTNQELVFLAERPLSAIEELLMEIMILQEKGAIVYASDAIRRETLFMEVRPSVVLTNDIQCFEMSDWIINSINSLKASTQQQVWKEFIRRKNVILNTNTLPIDPAERLIKPLLIQTGMDRLQLVVNMNDLPTCNCILFLRAFLLCPVIQAYAHQELGNLLFSSSFKDNNTFGHVGGPLMGMEVMMRSVPSRRLHITDRLQVRGVSSEEEMAEEFEEDVMDPSHNSNTHVLLCSSCQGRGEIWMRGVALSSTGSSEEMNGWINTNLYGLWRDDGTIELLDI